MAPGLSPLNETLGVALHKLGIKSNGYVLKDVPERRCVSRHGDIVVKTFALEEHDAWAREVAGVRALQSSGLTAHIVGSGELWVATEWIEGITPLSVEIDDDSIHQTLGATLAKIHAASPIGLESWSVADRLAERLNKPPDGFPNELLVKISNLSSGWKYFLKSQSFVHGDWGTANALVDPNNHANVLAVIDFEDSHIGDALEDFRWQVFAGPSSSQLRNTLKGYAKELGARASERMAFAAIELCLDTFNWDERIRKHSLQILQDFIDGWLPGV